MSPDPSGLAFANPANPQSLNLYGYGLSIPLTNVDPMGLAVQYNCTDTPGYGFDTVSNSLENPTAVALVYSGEQHCEAYDDGMGQPTDLLPPQRQSAPPQVNLPVVAPNSGCQLVAPTGQYCATPGTIVLFQPSFADSLSVGIGALNNQGITPVFTDGYRTQAMQNARRRAASSGASPFGAAQGISAHQVGLAADFGVNSNAGNNAAILRAMTGAGLVNGATQ